MIKRILFFWLLCISTSNLQAQDNSFKVSFFQKGIEIKNKHNVYNLNNKPFSIKLNSKGYNGFLIGVTFDRDIYLSALGEADLEVPWFANTGMAEVLFNADRSMFISDQAPSYWYYDDQKDHRFDPHPIGTYDNWEGIRTIEKFDDLLNNKIFKVDNINKSVYLFLYNPIYDDDYELVDVEVLFHAELRFVK